MHIICVQCTATLASCKVCSDMPFNESLQVLLGWLSPPPVSLFWTSKHVNKFVCCILIYPSCPAKQTCCCNVLFWHILQLLYFLLRNFCDQRVCLPFKGSSICHTSLQQTSYRQACFIAWETVCWVQSAETARGNSIICTSATLLSASTDHGLLCNRALHSKV